MVGVSGFEGIADTESDLSRCILGPVYPKFPRDDLESHKRSKKVADAPDNIGYHHLPATAHLRPLVPKLVEAV